ncbi:MAG: hypothetical protein AAB221_04050 [Bacteroidota bacterium]
MKQMINIFKNRKHKTNRSFIMPKFTTTIFLAFISLGLFAQKSALEKLGLKSLHQKVSYIPSKSFNSLVHTGSDSVLNYTSRISTVRGFYISKTEVTNKEYREFTHYVRDSIAHSLLHHYENGNTIDWKQKIDWKDERLDAMLPPVDERMFGSRNIDAGKLLFEIDFFGQKKPSAFILTRWYGCGISATLTMNRWRKNIFHIRHMTIILLLVSA